MRDLDRKLTQAAKQGDLAALRAALAAGADVHAENDHALRQAAYDGDLTIVQCLLDAGADVHAADNAALRDAVSRGHLATVRAHVEAGADTDVSSGSILCWAASNGRAAVIDYLLSVCAYSQAAIGETLKRAALFGHAGIVRTLRLHGARLSPLLPHLHHYSSEVQLAAIAMGRLWRISSGKHVRGLHLEALYVLLDRQGHGELTRMLRATRLLEPLAPAARALVLVDLLQRTSEVELAHAP